MAKADRKATSESLLLPTDSRSESEVRVSGSADPFQDTTTECSVRTTSCAVVPGLR